MKLIIFIILAFCVTTTFAQKIDTLNFYSSAFESNRTIYVKTPENFKYKSDSVRFPVFYVLDGQHEWFVKPLLNTVEYLQFTKEIPQAIIVVIPHQNRTSESAFKNLNQLLPLHQFITQDIEIHLERYDINNHRTIIGHSFTASFALYSYFKNPIFYEAVIANTPLHNFEELVVALNKKTLVKRENIFISIGGSRKDKDYYHRIKFDELKEKYPTFFNKINIFEAHYSAHNAVPIVANPSFLTKLFSDYRRRFFKIAEVNENYELINDPKTLEKEVNKILLASRITDHFYAPEIADLNGIASRYLSGNFIEHGIKTYELGLVYYPKFWGFHLSLYELLVEQNPVKSKDHLFKAEEYLQSLDNQHTEYLNVKDYITKEKEKNGW